MDRTMPPPVNSPAQNWLAERTRGDFGDALEAEEWEREVEALEEMFLLKEFAACLEATQSALERLSNPGTLGTTKLSSLHQRHRCASGGCPCGRLVTLYVQSLYELKRAHQVLPFILGFYGDDNLPEPIVWLCANLLASMDRSEEAKNMLAYYMRSSMLDRLSPQDRVRAYARLVELLFARFLLPRGELDEAAAFLAHHPRPDLLPAELRDALQEALMRARQQQHEQQQHQQHQQHQHQPVHQPQAQTETEEAARLEGSVPSPPTSNTVTNNTTGAAGAVSRRPMLGAGVQVEQSGVRWVLIGRCASVLALLWLSWMLLQRYRRRRQAAQAPLLGPLGRWGSAVWSSLLDLLRIAFSYNGVSPAYAPVLPSARQPRMRT